MKPKQRSRRLFGASGCLPEPGMGGRMSPCVNLLGFVGKSESGVLGSHSLPFFDPREGSEVRFSRREDEFALQRAMEVNTRYKKKAERHLPVKRLDESGEGPR